jgi:hypothetical protein
MNVARTAVLALAVLSVTAASPASAQTFQERGRPSPGLTQPNSFSVTKMKGYKASPARSLRSSEWQPRRIDHIAARVPRNSSRRLLLRNKGLTRAA